MYKKDKQMNGFSHARVFLDIVAETCLNILEISISIEVRLHCAK